jgi:hypothetical protein
MRPFSFNTYTELQAFTRIMIQGAEAPQFGHRPLPEAYCQAATAPAGGS